MSFRLAYRRYRLPFHAPVRTAHGVWAEREGLIVRIEGGDGRVGWGEVAPVPGFRVETVDEAEAACGALPTEISASADDGLPATLPCLRSALGAALAELESASPPYRPVLPVAALLPAGRAAIAAVPAKAEAGFRTFKWKVAAGDLREELPILGDVCAALPSGSRLRLDANGGWDRKGAEKWLDRCAGYPVEFIEQPVAPEARGAEDLLLGLAADYPTPLALDESIAGEADVERWLGLGWRGVFVVKPSLMGGVDGALGRLSTAKASIVFSSALETGIGARAALRTAFEWPGAIRALGFGVWPLFEDSRFDGPAAAPFIRWEDVQRIDREALWNALS